MRTASPSSELLNPRNQLTAHRVSRHILPSLVERSLCVTAELFPDEPTAALGLQQAYESIMFSDGKIEDCELFDYFIYTTGSADSCEVVGGAGLYRLITPDPQSKALLKRLASTPAARLGFVRDSPREPEEYLWGGRLGIKPNQARSPHTLPFIAKHILGTAVSLVKSRDFAPVLLAFTRRHNNHLVHRFYEKLSFEKTGEVLEYSGQAQDIFAMSLSSNAAALLRMCEATRKVLARSPGSSQES